MKRRPWLLIIIVWLHILAPIGNILMNTVYAGVELPHYLFLLIQPYNLHRFLIFVVTPILAGIMIYICKKLSYIIYILLMTVPVLYSAYTWYGSQNHQMFISVLLSYLVNILVVGFFMRSQVRKIYFDSRVRWWEAKPRFHADFKAEVASQAKRFEAQLMNLSDSGLFFQSEEELEHGDEVSIYFTAQDKDLELRGHVVYARKDAVHGFGVKFDDYGNSKRDLNEILKRLEKSGAIIESRLPGPEDSFLFWLKSVFRKKPAL